MKISPWAVQSCSVSMYGFDIMHVAEEAPSTKDIVILRLAQEQNRIIITFDRDYGELIFKHHLPAPAGVVYLRFDPDYRHGSKDVSIR